MYNRCLLVNNFIVVNSSWQCYSSVSFVGLARELFENFPLLTWSTSFRILQLDNVLLKSLVST
jgi:hypothetical protein